MKIVKKTEGRYLSYELRESMCYFDNGAVAVDLESEQRGADVTIDISIDGDGRIVRGVSRWYAAQLSIPARTYTVRENGITDEMGFRQITKTADPLNTDDVVLTRWALEV